MLLLLPCCSCCAIIVLVLLTERVLAPVLPKANIIIALRIFAIKRYKNRDKILEGMGSCTMGGGGC